MYFFDIIITYRLDKREMIDAPLRNFLVTKDGGFVIPSGVGTFGLLFTLSFDVDLVIVRNGDQVCA